MYLQHTVDNTMVYIQKGNYLAKFGHGKLKVHYLVKALMETA